MTAFDRGLGLAFLAVALMWASLRQQSEREGIVLAGTSIVAFVAAVVVLVIA